MKIIRCEFQKDQLFLERCCFDTEWLELAEFVSFGPAVKRVGDMISHKRERSIPINPRQVPLHLPQVHAVVIGALVVRLPSRHGARGNVAHPVAANTTNRGSNDRNAHKNDTTKANNQHLCLQPWATPQVGHAQVPHHAVIQRLWGVALGSVDLAFQHPSKVTVTTKRNPR